MASKGLNSTFTFLARWAILADFANNVLELGNKFGIKLEQTQPSQQAKPINIKSNSPDKP